MSQVELPKELLDWVRELEEKHQNLPSAVPLNQEELISKKKWGGGSVLVGVLCIVGLVLGITLGGDKTVANTVPQPTTTSPTIQEFVSLNSLIE
jgi:hypothetical protein